MDRIAATFLTTLTVIVVSIMGTKFSKLVIALVRRHFPGFSSEGETVLMAGLLALTAFAIGLVVMYLLLRL